MGKQIINVTTYIVSMIESVISKVKIKWRAKFASSKLGGHTYIITLSNTTLCNSLMMLNNVFISVANRYRNNCCLIYLNGDIAVAIGASLNILLSDHVARLMHDGMDEESEPNTWLFQILSSKTTKKITACRYYFCIQDCI